MPGVPGKTVGRPPALRKRHGLESGIAVVQLPSSRVIDDLLRVPDGGGI
jgi:hypothetical protein